MLDLLQDFNATKNHYDLIFVQELLRSKEEESLLQTQANRQGYHLAVHAAKRTTASGLTPGVGILTPFRLGLANVDIPDSVAKPARERMLARLWSGFAGRIILVVSLYLHSGLGLGLDNMYLLEQVGAYLHAVGLPYIIGADWNVKPEGLEESG